MFEVHGNCRPSTLPTLLDVQPHRTTLQCFLTHLKFIVIGVNIDPFLPLSSRRENLGKVSDQRAWTVMDPQIPRQVVARKQTLTPTMRINLRSASVAFMRPKQGNGGRSDQKCKTLAWGEQA